MQYPTAHPLQPTLICARVALKCVSIDVIECVCGGGTGAASPGMQYQHMLVSIKSQYDYIVSD